MGFAFVVAQGEELARVAEIQTNGVFKHTYTTTWEVLEHCVAWYVNEFDSILLPFGANCEDLRSRVELQVSDGCCQIHNAFQGLCCIQSLCMWVEFVHINYSHVRTSC